MNERQIFEGALAFQSPADRQAFLDKACAGNDALRAQVEALLASHEANSAFLNVSAVDQLRGDPHKLLAQTMDSSQISGQPHVDIDDDEVSGPDLSFLQPSSKPGSIGCLGHYEILQVLGQGAFGIVFRAFDEKLHRQVAVKAMNPQLAATSPPRKRFLREARSVAAIKHENIVQIYGVEEQPLPYLVMEFVQGQTLQQKLDGNGPLEVSELLHLGRQMAAGLAAAHGLGLIHRDIKPGNILLEQGAEQKVKITDFGLARAADDASMTNTGVISGTPLYMAPEQAQGHALDARTDLFSLGSVLYQMCTGRPPFRAANTLAVLKRVVEDTPRSLAEIIADTPRWFEAIVMKLLEKDPARRYQSAKEVADLLRNCQNELQVNGKVTCVPNIGSAIASTVSLERFEPPLPAKRNQWVAALPALIVVVLLGMYLINRAVDRFYRPASINVPKGGSASIVPASEVARTTTAETPATYFDKNRRAAERALAVGGEVTVEITEPFEWRTLKGSDAQLPREPFVVRMWSIKTSTTAKSSDLDVLAGLRQVLSVNLMANTKLDASVIRKLAAMQSPVKELGTGHIGLKGSDLDQLPVMPEVQTLWLSAGQIDDQWRFLRRFPALRTIELYGPPPDLSPLRDVPQLRCLRLSGTGEQLPGDTSIRDIQSRNQNLRILVQTDSDLQILGVDPARVAARRLIETGISVDYFGFAGDLKPLPPADVEQIVAATYVVRKLPQGDILTDELRHILTHMSLQHFTAKGLQNADALARLLRDRHDIDHLELTDSDLSDEGLQQLSQLAGLRGLHVKGTRVTAVGVANFHRAVPCCHIEATWGGTKPDFSAIPSKYPN